MGRKNVRLYAWIHLLYLYPPTAGGSHGFLIFGLPLSPSCSNYPPSHHTYACAVIVVGDIENRPKMDIGR